MSELINADLVSLDLHAASKEEAIRTLAELMVSAGRASDADLLFRDVLAREAQMQTGIEGGIGIPHARTSAVAEPTLAFAKAPEGVDFGSADGPADLIFLITVPEGSDADHMKIIASLARRLVHESFRAGLRGVDSKADAAQLILREVFS